MRAATRAPFLAGVILGAVAVVVVGSNLVAERQAKTLGLQDEGVVFASARSKRATATPSPGAPIRVTRAGLPPIEFTDEKAVAFEIESARDGLSRFEAALRKDLSRGDFRAPRTRVVTRSGPSRGSGAAEELALARRELDELRAALRRDLAHGDFRAPHIAASVTTAGRVRSTRAGDPVASGVVAVTDDLWDLEVAFEQDIHAGSVRAAETHFAIDRRRWKVD